MKPTKKWQKMAEIYKRFAKDYPWFDFSDTAAEEMFRFESIGGEKPSKNNGYALGKKWMDVTVAAWNEDLSVGLLTMGELRQDFPAWFLSSVIKPYRVEAW